MTRQRCQSGLQRDRCLKGDFVSDRREDVCKCVLDSVMKAHATFAEGAVDSMSRETIKGTSTRKAEGAIRKSGRVRTREGWCCRCDLKTKTLRTEEEEFLLRQ